MTPAGRPSRIFAGVPPHGLGQRIGLWGGSFNPPHAGHRQASLLALGRLDLDCVWWLVTPGNPLKATSALPPHAERMRAAARIAAHPRIVVTGAEQSFGTRYTADLLRRLRDREPATRFVWIMGSDNLAQLHRWERWRDIASTVPLAVVNRPGWLTAALSAPAAQALRLARLDESRAVDLAGRRPPAWTFLTTPRTPVSSTELRARDPG